DARVAIPFVLPGCRIAADNPRRTKATHRAAHCLNGRLPGIARLIGEPLDRRGNSNFGVAIGGNDHRRQSDGSKKSKRDNGSSNNGGRGDVAWFTAIRGECGEGTTGKPVRRGPISSSPKGCSTDCRC